MLKLFGLLYKELIKNEVYADDVYSFTKERRRDLQFLEECYYLGRYGDENFDERDSELCLRVAREGIELLGRVRERLETISPS